MRFLNQTSVILLAIFVFSVTGYSQQTISSDQLSKSVKFNPERDRIADVQSSSNNSGQTTQSQIGASSSATIRSVQIGSAGNAYTIAHAQGNYVDALPALETILFIHRQNPNVSPSSTNSRYRYDVSKDDGITWDINNGPLNPSANSSDKSARYPNTVLYNSTGSSNPDSSHLVYLGSSHNNGNWNATFSGTGQLDSSGFTENYNVRNGGNVLIPTGFTEGAEDEFWAVDYAYDGSQLNDILVYKGTWDDATETVNFSIDTTISPPYFGSQQVTSLNMDFGPNGKYGWISMLADFNPDSTFYPVFYKTTDSGKTWTGPIEVTLNRFDLDTFVDTNGDTLYPTTAFDSDIGVDKNGDPHLITVLGVGNNLSINLGLMDMYDITFFSDSSQWRAYWLDSVNTLRGCYGGSSCNSAGDGINEDNRPQISMSESGDMAYAFWADTEPTAACYDPNDPSNCAPNLKGVALDLETRYRTTSRNFTLGDATWEGNVLLPCASQTALPDHETPIVAMELTGSDIDPVYFHYLDGINFQDTSFNICLEPNAAPNLTLAGPSTDTFEVGQCPGTYTDPGYKAFSCSNDITEDVVVFGDNVDTTSKGTYTVKYHVTDSTTMKESDTLIRYVKVTLSDLTPPQIDLNDSDYVCLEKDASFNDPGATATDNCFGDLSDSIQVNSSLDSSTVGEYNISYSVTDSSGNTAVTTRTVAVKKLDPHFNFTKTATGGKVQVQFEDSSFTDITYWKWAFGDGTVKFTQNPQHNYTYNDTFNVCLTIENCIEGKSATTCQDLVITQASIKDQPLAGKIQYYPNPTAGEITITFPQLKSQQLQIEVYNTVGERLRHLNDLEGKDEVNLDLSEQPNGIYFLKFKNEEGVITKKVTLTK